MERCSTQMKRIDDTDGKMQKRRRKDGVNPISGEGMRANKT